MYTNNTPQDRMENISHFLHKIINPRIDKEDDHIKCFIKYV